MVRFLAQHVRRPVRLFAGIGLVMAANIQLDWTPAAPWTPAMKVLAAAVTWGPTAPLSRSFVSAMNGTCWQIMGPSY